MKTIIVEKDWIGNCVDLLKKVNGGCRSNILTELNDQYLKDNGGLPIFDENSDGIHAEIRDDNDYCITIDGKEEIRVNRNGLTASLLRVSGDQELYYQYQWCNGFYEVVTSEDISKKEKEMNESQINLIDEIYSALAIDGMAFDRVIFPNNFGHKEGCYPIEYVCIDKANHRSLSFSNKEGLIINICCFGEGYADSEPKQDSIYITVNGNVATLNAYVSDKGKVSYDTYAPSTEVSDYLKKVVKVLSDYGIDVSELPTELTDQTQYSQ